MDLMTTYTGLQFNPMVITEKDVCKADIAHALSLICRGGGHLKYFYSVGQHSVNCAVEAKARGLDRPVVFACLLHDASEAYISDIIRPVKKYIPEYFNIEEKIMKVILQKFGLGALTAPEIKEVRQIDDDILLYELKNLLNVERTIGEPELMSVPDISLHSTEDIERKFLRMMEELEQ